MSIYKSEMRIVGMEWDPHKPSDKKADRVLYTVRCGKCNEDFHISPKHSRVVLCPQPECDDAGLMGKMVEDYLVGVNDLLQEWLKNDQLMALEALLRRPVSKYSHKIG